MDAMLPIFTVQRAVIPLWKALTKLFKWNFMRKVLFISQNCYFWAPSAGPKKRDFAILLTRRKMSPNQNGWSYNVKIE